MEVVVDAVVVMMMFAVAAATSNDRCYSIQILGQKLGHSPNRSDRKVCVDSFSKKSTTGEFRSHSSSQKIPIPNRTALASILFASPECRYSLPPIPTTAGFDALYPQTGDGPNTFGV